MIIVMHDEDNKILKHNHGEKSMRVPFIIYADLKCLLEKNALMSKLSWKILCREKN